MSDFAATRILLEPSAGLGRPHRVRQFLHVATVVLIVLATVWAVYAFTVPHYAQLIGDLVLIAAGVVSLALLRAGRVTAAIHWLLIALLTWVPTMGLIVYIIGLHFVLFDAARIVQTFYVSAAILIFIVVEYNLIPLNPRYGFPRHDVVFAHGLTLGLVLVAIALIMRAYIADLAEAERRARDANQRSEQLLQSVLPAAIVARVRTQGTTFTQRVDECSVLFADIVGFTPLASRLPAEELVALLNRVFRRFDELTQAHGVEKIKTIGDAYMAACGLPEPQADHAQRIARLGLGFVSAIDEFEDLSIRVGINSGPVVAGIIGQRRIAFDLWGETVNLASRMESHGADNRIQVTSATYELLRSGFVFDEGRTLEVKGKGPVMAYFLLGEQTDSNPHITRLQR
jgi:class 3 adenylate cyclase